jgi:hypothetical protein
MANETQDSFPVSNFNYLEAKLDQFDNSYKLLSTISSLNFDGAIPSDILSYPNATTEDLVSGRSLLIGDEFYLITRIIENIDDETTNTESYEVFYIQDGIEKSKTILTLANSFTDGTHLAIGKDDWENKSVGQSGWTITTEGNSIFSNVAVRGRLEATEGYFDGRIFVGDPLDPNSLGSMRIGTNVDGTIESPGTQDGIFINENNYWYDTGDFSIGSSGSGVVWDGTALNVTGIISATSGNIGGTFGWQIQGSKIFSGSGETYIALQSSGDAIEVPISSIVINDEGDDLSSIYILSEIPEGYTLSNIEDLYGTSLSFPSDSGVILNNNNINKLKDFAYPIQEVSFSQWSLSNGEAEEGDPAPEGYVTFIIYGEDNDQTFVDETVSNITEENILIGNLSDNSGIWLGNEIFTEAPFSVNQSGVLKASSGEIGGFSFDEISDEGTGGDFNSLSEIFDRGTYSPP